jgi:hypothetical protein
MRKKEENNKLKENIKDWIALNFKINKKLETSFGSFRMKKIKRKQFQMQFKERPGKFKRLTGN